MDTSALCCDPSEFCRALEGMLQVHNLTEIACAVHEPAVQLPIVTVADPYALVDEEKAAIGRNFNSRFLAACLRTAETRIRPGKHPLVALGEQLCDVLPSAIQVRYAIEAEDGTGKVFDTGDPNRLARSNRAMSAHQDGFRSGARIKLVGLWADSVGAANPRTFMQNLLRISVDLLKVDEPAFRSLFRRDAMTIRRKIDGETVCSPILGLTEGGLPRIFFRAPGEDFDVWPSDSSAGRRGFEYLVNSSQLDAPGSAYVELAPVGTAVLFDNYANVHGRTAFVNGATVNEMRVLAVAAWAEPGDDSPGVVGTR